MRVFSKKEKDLVNKILRPAGLTVSGASIGGGDIWMTISSVIGTSRMPATKASKFRDQLHEHFSFDRLVLDGIIV